MRRDKPQISYRGDLAILSICGQEVIVDRRDEQLLTRHRWGIYDGYVLAGDGRKGGSALLRLHRLVAQAAMDRIVDHKNGNGLDNRRDNLRQCEHFENMANRRKIQGKVPYKGVHLNNGRYKAKIMVRGKDIYLGRFDDPRQAARAYDEAALRHFGEFAATNAELLGQEALL